MAAEWIKHEGGCHCGRVRFHVLAPAELEVRECNCSICRKSGFLHLIVPKANFTLLKGGDSLSTYSFNTGVAQHLFCKICGIKSFYVPRSNPDGYSVNVHCFDRGTISKLTVTQLDGENWEANGVELAGLSK